MRRVVMAIVMVAIAAGVALAQGEESRPVAAAKRVPRLSERLGALTPDKPRAYFELGEEVASEASEDLDRRLARQLFVLAYELSKRSAQSDTQLPASVCLALASIAENDEERRWLAALAETLAPPGSPPPDPVRIKSSAASRDPAAFDLASMLGLARMGEGRRAERFLQRPGVERLLDKCDPLLMPGAGGGASKVRRQMAEWPNCPRCSNKRFVRDSSGIQLCPHCKGAPGPKLGRLELVGHIRTESLLLSGQQRSWAGQIISDYGAPVRELDASELAGTYAIDPARPLWRDGRWVAGAATGKTPSDAATDATVEKPAAGTEAAPAKQPATP